MKKFTTLLFLALFVAFTGNAQECGPTDPPYYLDFESGLFVPDCTVSSSEGSPNFWQNDNNPIEGFSGKALKYTGGTLDANSKFYTRGINLTGGTPYRITYKYANSGGGTESFLFTYGTAATAEAATPVTVTTTFSDGVLHNASFSYFTVPTTGVYYFGFSALSAANQGAMYIDDFKIEPTSCGIVQNLAVSSITQTGASINWAAATGGNVTPLGFYQYALNTSATPPATGTAVFSTTQTNTTLTPGTTYYVYVRSVCGSNVYGDWVTTSFTTPSCDVATIPYALDFENVTTPALPACTSVAAITTGSQWATVAAPGNGFDSNALQYTGTTTAAGASFFTQGIQINAGTYYRVYYKYGNNSATGTENFTVTLNTSPNPASVSSTFATHTATGGTPQTNNVTLFNIPTSGVYYFGFNVTTPANGGNLTIDDFVIEPQVCGVPSSIVINNVTQTGASVSWAAPTTGNLPMVSVYQYAYGTTNTLPTEGTFNPGTTATLSGLLPGTTYYVFNRTLCGPIWSEWYTTTFTTPSCDTTTIPYTQDFESTTVPGMPTCTTLGTTAGNQWVTADAPGNGFTTKTLQYTGTDAAANAWLFTQGIQLTAGTNYKITYKYGNNSNITTESFQVTMGTSPNAASVLVPVGGQAAITGGALATFTSAPISVATDGIYYFGFNANSTASQGTLFIDDVTISLWDCGTPQDITISNVTQTGAIVTWAAPAENTSFGYFVGTSTNINFPDGGPYVNGLTTNLIDLLPGTTYYVFLKSQCGPLMGDWSDYVSFTTPACDATTVPYYQDFESATVPAIPSCTTIGDADTGNEWVTSNNPGSGFTNNALHYYPSDETADAWFFTQGVQLTAGTYYKISYTFGNNSAGTTEKLKVAIATNPNPGFLVGTDPLGDHIVTGATPATNAINYFNVTESGVYYLGFNAHSASEEGHLYVDAIAIEENVCGVTTNVVISDITTTTATIEWQAPTTGNTPATVYQYAYGTTNTPPAEGTFIPELTIDLADLEPNTTYYVFTRTQCGPLWSDWTITEFTTQDDTTGLGDVTFNKLKVYPNPTSNIITIDNAAAIDSVEVYNITGQLVLKQNIGSTNTTINLENLQAGAYLLNVYANDATKRVKIIKQ
ncbi:fibronectin type III domain-containing protein [Flavobacterium subsaxonicum]|uniref:Fibronectin type-III domain-containing protein n=1 Tax=Flavobacterium subsaxonicum WB 4.1-42 = DSM 21790 TaxID=1121898 RepID=A0A0A2MPP0_9FLAO|nr:fibronectin type III domain-containing protein [Flavobacterium subsaxonicum]KGO93448.1 hypothetical protein Q766_09140 [Flavobacterium subsaxonicum WB 4.1-42 = DSM 21790]